MAITVRKWGIRALVGAMALLLIGFGVGSLANRSSQRPAAGSITQASTSRVSAGAGTAESAVTGRAGPEDGGAAGAIAPQGAAVARDDVAGGAVLPDRVILNADISVEVSRDRFERAWASAQNLAAKYGGQIASSHRGGGEQPVPVAQDGSRDTDLFGTITLRIPASSFEKALADMRALGEVTTEAVGSQDVTEEFVDLESRLRHLRSEEAVLLRLMRRARSIEETLQVREQLSGIQLQIEETTGRLRFLENRTELATIVLNLAEPGALGAGEGPSFSEAWRTAIDGLERIAIGAMVAVLWLAPFALGGLLVYQGVRRWRHRPAPQP